METVTLNWTDYRLLIRMIFGEDFKSFEIHGHSVIDDNRISEISIKSCPFMHCILYCRIMSKILKKLSYLDFPENSRQALQYVASCYSDGSTHHGLSIPGLESASENWAYEVCHEYIYFHSSSRRAAQVKRNLVAEHFVANFFIA